MTRILIADDHDVGRAGLRAILQSQAGWEVVAEASDGKEAVELAVATRPDVAVLDFGLPTLNGVEATRQIRSKLPRVEILIFTMHDTDALVRDVLEAGARGFLLKSDASRFLISAVETLADHKPFFTGSVSEALLESFLLKKPIDGSADGTREVRDPAHCRRASEPKNRRSSLDQHQVGRDASRFGAEEAQRRFDGGADPLRDQEQARRGLTRARGHGPSPASFLGNAARASRVNPNSM